jgi:hypothetical protein
MGQAKTLAIAVRNTTTEQRFAALLARLFVSGECPPVNV